MTPEPDPNSALDPERMARGLAAYRQVYGDDAVVFEPGQVEFFDLMIAHVFGEVWARPALDVGQRRLLVMGVLAAQHRFDTLEMQLTRALDTGEVDVQQVRDVVIQLIPYVGYPSSSDLFRVSEAAIAEHEGPAA